MHNHNQNNHLINILTTNNVFIIINVLFLGAFTLFRNYRNYEIEIPTCKKRSRPRRTRNYSF